MLERLDYLRLAPRRILDAGAGPAREARALVKRYAGARVVAADFSLEMLRAGRRRVFFFERNPALALCADLARLPLADGTVDVAWCNMALHWVADPLAVLRELHRVLAGEGLLMLSTLGPDTLQELRAAAGEARVHRFADMHDVGDMLVAAGFAAPVMDMEKIAVQYPRVKTLLHDLRGSGQTSARSDRPRGLAGRAFGERLRASLGSRATFEVVYGHAWKALPQRRRGARDIVQFHPPSLR